MKIGITEITQLLLFDLGNCQLIYNYSIQHDSFF